MKRNYLLMLLLAAIVPFFVACSVNEDNPTTPDKPSEPTVKDGTVNINGIVSIDGNVLSEQKYTINSFVTSSNISNGNFDVEVPVNDYPQLVYLTNDNDDIILMSRESISNTGKVEINEETTALALITTHPLFVRMTNEEYDDVIELIKNTSSYSAYFDEVKKAIKNRKDIFDINNTALMVAYNNVLEDLCRNVYQPARTRSAAIFTRAAEVTGITTDPVQVTAEGKRVIIRNQGLVPTYELQIYHGARMMDLGTNSLVKSHKSYGILDWLNPNVHFGDLGDPGEIYLSEEGEYRFYLDNTTERAQRDLRDRLLNDALSILGLGFDTAAGDNTTLGFIAGAGMDVWQLMVNPDTQWNDWVMTLSKWSLQGGVLLKWENVGKVLGKAMVIYNALKGAGNEIARIRMGFTANHFVDFCLCQYQNAITSCTESEIEKVSGDNQEGFAGQRLMLPLVVSTKVFADDGSEIERSTYQKVKFEVISGGGTVSQEIVGTEIDSKNASTYWTIGESGEQQVKAVVVDMVTGVEVSQPVYFTAKLRENADLTIRLDWHKLSGNTDIDLHVTDPYGEEIAYYHMNSASGGWLDRDDVVGPGPEHIYWTNAPSGAYLVQVHYYGSETQAITTYTVTINANGTNYGPFSGSIAYHQLVTIGVLNLPSGTFTRAASSDVPAFLEKKEIQDNIIFPFKK